MIAEQIRWALDQLPPARHIKLYNSGNFFDPNAIPPEDYEQIAELVSGFDTVIVESLVKQLQEDTNERAKRARVLFASGLATRNEARNIAGLTPLAPERGDALAAVTTISRDSLQARTTP